eukprot:3003815-Lingulodinium_polyedra.AAC.1
MEVCPRGAFFQRLRSVWSGRRAGVRPALGVFVAPELKEGGGVQFIGLLPVRSGSGVPGVA